MAKLKTVNIAMLAISDFSVPVEISCALPVILAPFFIAVIVEGDVFAARLLGPRNKTCIRADRDRAILPEVGTSNRDFCT